MIRRTIMTEVSKVLGHRFGLDRLFLVALAVIVTFTSLQASATESVTLSAAQQGRMQEAYKFYRTEAERGVWPYVPMTNPGTKAETQRLESAAVEVLLRTGDLSRRYIGVPARKIPEADRNEAIKLFQARHGIYPDGKLGYHTRAAMNVKPEYRAQQIAVNLQRLKKFRTDQPRYIVVNTSGHFLSLVENNEAVLNLRTMSGRTDRQTPDFSTQISSLTINPAWNVPPGILRNDLIPRFRQDPSFVERNHFKLIDSKGQEVDPFSVNWSSINSKNFPYRVQRRPGTANPLGRLRFMMPNQYYVFIHDTPQKGLFNRMNRGISSGCVRVENPEELAARISRGALEAEDLKSRMMSGQTEDISLPSTIPVHMVYLTAWVDQNGQVNFREDRYQRDGLPRIALEGADPDAGSDAQAIVQAEAMSPEDIAASGEDTWVTPTMSAAEIAALEAAVQNEMRNENGNARLEDWYGKPTGENTATENEPSQQL
jgi:murein L,D-transpeptidase YcbB/YkuD